MGMARPLDVRDGIGWFDLPSECSLVEASELIRNAIGRCRERGVDKLLIDGRALVRMSVPSLVDRFLMAEEWAQAAKRKVVVALVLDARYVHPEKFGIRVATDLGLTVDVYTSESDALAWLLHAGGAAADRSLGAG